MCGDRGAPSVPRPMRVIVCEMNRIQSHLLWFGTFLLDLGGITPFLYCFDDREEILGILDRVTGSRLTYAYGRFGGVTMRRGRQCLPRAGHAGVPRPACAPGSRCTRTSLGANVIFRERCEGVGVDEAERRPVSYGITGPMLRAAGGVEYDVRRAEPYGGYDKIRLRDSDHAQRRRLHGAVPRARCAEMEQSCSHRRAGDRRAPGG